MLDHFTDRLTELKERKYQLNRAERRREELQKRLKEQERLIVKLEVELESEQADVEQLTRMSLANLFRTILRNKEEQLEMERQQVLAAALKLQEAKQALEETKEELAKVGSELSEFRDAEYEYNRLMIEKEAALRDSWEYASQLLELDTQITDKGLFVKEVQEAWTAGRRVLASLTAGSASLEKAENWGKWDMWANGGLISTHIKHNHVDDARQAIHDANRLLRDFRDELADLKRTVNINVDISDTLKLADYWFDGLITDWIVQGRINNAQEKTLEAIHQVRMVVRELEQSHAAAERELQALKTQRAAWIEGTIEL